MKVIIVVAVCVLAVACEGRSRLQSMDNFELMSKRDECLNKRPTAPGNVMACENIRKECERRRQSGNYTC